MAVIEPAQSHLATMRDILMEERQRLLAEAAAISKRERDFSLLQKMDGDGGAGGDSADVATEMFEQELALGLEQHLRAHLVDLDDALARVESGEYGLCEDCNEPINPERLRALPRARRCLQCQQHREVMARTGRMPVSFTAAAKRRTATPARAARP